MRQQIQFESQAVAMAIPRQLAIGARVGWLLRLATLVFLLLLLSAIVTQVSFAGDAAAASLTSRAFTAVQARVESALASSQRFVNDLRSLHGIQRLAEQGPVAAEAASSGSSEAAPSSGPTACD